MQFFCLNNLFNRQELEELRLGSIEILKNLLNHLEKSSAPKEIQWEKEFTDKNIVGIDWYQGFIAELFKYFSVYGKNRINLTCNEEFYSILEKYTPQEAVPKIQEKLTLLSSISFNHISDTTKLYWNKSHSHIKPIWAKILYIYKEALYSWGLHELFKNINFLVHDDR